MLNNMRVNVLNGFNYQMPQFQVSSAYTKEQWKKCKKWFNMPRSPLYL